LAMSERLAAPRATVWTYAGLFMVTLATLMYEIGLTRIFSVTMWYHFAFVAISVALFGMTLGALLVHLLPQRFPAAGVKTQLWVASLLFAVSLAVCFAVQLSIPFTPELTPGGVASVVGTCLVISVPFTFSGVVVCLALTRFPRRVNRLYAADLVGAALGCVLLIVLFSQFDGPSVIVAVAGLAAVGALAFALDGVTRSASVACGAVAAGLLAFSIVNADLATSGDAPLRIRWAKESRDIRHDFERWNAFSRLTVDGDPDADVRPYGYGMSPRLPADLTVNQLAMVIDSTAGTALTRYTGDPSETDGLRYDVTNLAHYVRPDSDVLVVGVGGGRDVLSALEFDQRSVTGVEINGDILDITNNRYGDFTGHLDRNPKVRFVNDEARSYLARTDRRFDIIQISLIDTWAATSAGAYALSENSLYTTDAWEEFFDSLDEGGVLSVSRWYSLADNERPLEMYRTAALAAETLSERGVEDPRQHMLIYKSPEQEIFGTTVSAGTLLVSPDPFTDADVARLGRDVERLDFEPVLTPDATVDEVFADLAAADGPGAAVDRFDEDISAPTDNRPFFFQMADLGTLASGDVFKDSMTTRPVLTLSLLALTVLLLAACCIALPLLLGRRGRSSGEPGLATRGNVPFYTYFAGIGLGFLLVEVAQLQRLSIFLGHPTYALGVVLFSVLLFSGVGSMLSERVVPSERTMVRPLYVLLGVVLVLGFLTPRIIEAADSFTTPMRILVAVLVLMPLGLLMGMPFSLGMRAAAARPGTPTAFLWGINGATSVCASVLGMVLALFLGISFAFWAGLLAYVVATLSLLVITREPQEATEPVEAVSPQPGPTGAPVGVG
jgi:hypothetical protein